MPDETRALTEAERRQARELEARCRYRAEVARINRSTEREIDEAISKRFRRALARATGEGT